LHLKSSGGVLGWPSFSGESSFAADFKNNNVVPHRHMMIFDESLAESIDNFPGLWSGLTA
jgi:hypothetical protein